MCDYCAYAEITKSKKLKPEPALCNFCCLEDFSIASLMLHEDKWIHRECREYSFLFNNSNYCKVINIPLNDYENKNNQCEQCWISTGSMIKCMVPDCEIKSHLFCARIKRKIFEIYMIPVRELNLLFSIIFAAFTLNFINYLDLLIFQN